MAEGTGGARRFTRLALVAVAVVASACTFTLASAARADEPALPPAVPGPVVLIGTSGIRWADIDAATTPTLADLAAEGAVGTLAVRSLRSYACPADGWLAISSGRLAAAPPTTASAAVCDPIQNATADATVPGWQLAQQRAQEDDRGAVIGSFGDALAEQGTSVAAIGAGAAIAIAGTDGIPVGPVTRTPGDDAELEAQVRELADGVELLVIDIGGVRAPPETDVTRSEQLGLVDDRVGAVFRALPSGATVFVASLADDGSTPHLQVLAATGADNEARYTDALLGSRSTRQPGLVQTTDLGPTVLRLLGVPSPSTFVGSPVIPVEVGAAGSNERLRALTDLDAAAQKISPYTVWFFGGLTLLHLLVYGSALLLLRRTGPTAPSRARVLVWLRRVGIFFSCLPVATFPANLLPWWRSDASFGVLVGTVAVIALGLAAIALSGPWRHRLLGALGFVGGVTAGVLALDVITGSRLMISSLMGLQPLVAGRFYGLGNVAFTIFATGAVLLATALADALLRSRRRALAIVVIVVIGAIAIILDGAPGLGSDFGGPLAMVPAFGLLVVMVGRLRSSWRLAVGIGLGAVVVVVGLALLDWLRPADQRTHLGRFVDEVSNGEAWQVVGRKLHQNLDLLVGSVGGPLVILVFGFLAVAVLRPTLLRLPSLPEAYERAPALRPGLLAMLVLVVLGSALNDSGSAVSAVAAAVTVPLLVATAAAVAYEQATRSPEGATVAVTSSAAPDPIAPGRGSAGDVGGQPVEPLR
jgi:hypothetical protein